MVHPLEILKENFYQKTLSKSLSFEGIGLHSGKNAVLDLFPAPENHGIVFVKDGYEIALHPLSVKNTYYCTTIGHEEILIKTVEHFVSALMMLGISNLRCELHGEEVPILDGSSSVFCQLMQPYVVSQNQERQWLYINQAVEVSLEQSRAVIRPASIPSMTVHLDYQHPAINSQGLTASFGLYHSSLIEDISKARTYGFEKDWPLYQKVGLALGASVSNALIYQDEGIMNPEGSRYPNEITRHKVLDMLGDLAVLGAPVWGEIEAWRPGHTISFHLVKKILEQNAYALLSSSLLAQHLNVTV